MTLCISIVYKKCILLIIREAKPINNHSAALITFEITAIFISQEKIFINYEGNISKGPRDNSDGENIAIKYRIIAIWWCKGYKIIWLHFVLYFIIVFLLNREASHHKDRIHWIWCEKLATKLFFFYKKHFVNLTKPAKFTFMTIEVFRMDIERNFRTWSENKILILHVCLFRSISECKN